MLIVCALGPGVQATATQDAPQRGVSGTRQQIFDAWLATDAVVIATYHGIDSTLGSHYHAAEVEQVWSGSPARGRVLFKAARGIRARPGDRVLLLLWDRLAGAPDSYLEEAKARHGDGVWATIGHDSLAAYLLPFATYSYPLDGDRLVLRGRSPIPTTIDVGALARDVARWEAQHSAPRLYAASELVVRARVTRAEVRPRLQHGIVAEWRVHCALAVVETYKGQTPDSLSLEFISFPRAPRFRDGDEVILFLSRSDGRPFLAAGKRAVFHVQAGEVVEAGRPLPEFVKQMRGA